MFRFTTQVWISTMSNDPMTCPNPTCGGIRSVMLAKPGTANLSTSAVEKLFAFHFIPIPLSRLPRVGVRQAGRGQRDRHIVDLLAPCEVGDPLGGDARAPIECACEHPCDRSYGVGVISEVD